MTVNQKNILEWAQKITKDIYLEFKKYDWEYGIKVFYTPVTQDNPPLVLISYQPGGDRGYYEREDKNNFEAGNFLPPEKNVYCIVENAMSRHIRALFQCAPNFLDQMVAFPLIFFRAPDVKTWKREMGDRRKYVENFCFEKVKEILNRLKPKKIVILGIDTYLLMVRKSILMDVKDEKEILGVKNNRRLAITSMIGKQKIFAMLHPTGARISKEDRDAIQREFCKWIQN
ncbi:MAG: hypothetical protein AAB544_02850 [Patescibacteria group bacterium]